MGIITFDSS